MRAAVLCLSVACAGACTAYMRAQAYKVARLLMVNYHESTLPFYVPVVLGDLGVSRCFIHFGKVCLQAEEKVSLLLHITTVTFFSQTRDQMEKLCQGDPKCKKNGKYNVERPTVKARSP